MMKAGVNKSRPCGNPGLDHENLSAPTEAPGRFLEETPDVRHVMQDVREDNGAQRGFWEWHPLGVRDKRMPRQ